MNMEGRVGVVTGGATGLGLQMATALAEAGANVVICSRKLENCEEAAHSIEKLGVKALAYGCDVTKPEQVEALKEATMQKFGRVDALINNAGRAGWRRSRTCRWTAGSRCLISISPRLFCARRPSAVR